MTDIEVKSVKAQLKLSDDIMGAYRMIFNYIFNDVIAIQRDLINEKFSSMKNDEVTFTKDELNKVRILLNNIRDYDSLKSLSGNSCKRHIDEIETKREILRML